MRAEGSNGRIPPTIILHVFIHIYWWFIHLLSLLLFWYIRLIDYYRVRILFQDVILRCHCSVHTTRLICTRLIGFQQFLFRFHQWKLLLFFFRRNVSPRLDYEEKGRWDFATAFGLRQQGLHSRSARHDSNGLWYYPCLGAFPNRISIYVTARKSGVLVILSAFQAIGSLVTLFRLWRNLGPNCGTLFGGLC